MKLTESVEQQAKTVPGWIFIMGLIIISLVVISRYNYLLFHSLVEMFVVLVTSSIFIVVWNSRKYWQNNYFVFLGGSALFISLIVLLHALAYKGLGVFSEPGSNLAAQLWILSRYLLGFFFILAPLTLKQDLKINRIIFEYTLLTGLLLGTIFYWKIFPVCYVEGLGLTIFKTFSEIFISGIFLLALVMLERNKQFFDSEVKRWLKASLASFIISELFFVAYLNVYGVANQIGHFFELAGFYLLYKATVEIGLTKPYQLIFRSLKHSEEQLKQEKERFQRYLNITGTIIVIIDNDQKIILINKKGTDILGYPVAEIVGKGWFDNYFPIRKREQAREVFRKLIREEIKPVDHFESPLLIKNGEERIISWNYSIIKDEQNKIVAAIGSGEDITERKKTDEIVAELASFPEMDPGPICEMDMFGKIIYLNPSASDLFPGLAEQASYHPYTEGFETIAAEFYRKKTSLPIVREVKVKDAFYQQTISYIRKNQSLRIYGTDITKRKEAERILKQAQEKLEHLVAKRTAELAEANKQLQVDMKELRDKEYRIKTSNELLKLLTQTSSRKGYLDGVIKFVSTLTSCRCAGIRVVNDEGGIPYEAYTGFSQQFWESENWLTLAKDHCACIRVITGTPEPQDTPAMTAGGSFCCANTHSFFSGLSEQEKSRFRGICLENGYATVVIIPIKYNEKIYGAIHLADEREGVVSAERVKLLEALTPLVGEGIHKFVMAEKMEEATKQLTEAKRLSDIGVLAATVAHELRNPLAAMRMAVYNIRKKAQNSLLDRNLDNIEKKITESNQIINNLLFYSRLKTPCYEITRIGDIIEECINLAKERFSDKSVVINKNIEILQEVSMEADPLLMKELFSNLLNNAYDAINHSDGKIEIGIKQAEGEAMSVYIRDNGIGMTPEILKKASDPFFTTKSKGTGLGLSVCNQIVHVHKGDITIDSEKDVGTTIIVNVPKRIRVDDEANIDY